MRYSSAEEINKICQDDGISTVFVAIDLTNEYQDLDKMEEAIKQVNIEKSGYIAIPGFFGVCVTAADEAFYRLTQSGKLLVLYGDPTYIQIDNAFNLTLMRQLYESKDRPALVKQICENLKMFLDSPEDNEVSETLKRLDITAPETSYYFFDVYDDVVDKLRKELLVFGPYEVIVAVSGGIRTETLKELADLIELKFGATSRIHIALDDAEFQGDLGEISILTCPVGPAPRDVR